jgi:hypothetical protein
MTDGRRRNVPVAKHHLPIVFCLLLLGCQQFDTPEMARMSEREKDSYRALGRYFTCMERFVKRAKAGPPLTDDQVNGFGYRCLPELQDAARKRERYFTAEPRDPDTGNFFSAPTRAARIKLHEKDLAAVFWCDFRVCLTM